MSLVLPENQFTEHNGRQVHWFIGDYNTSLQAWEAWGSCNGHAYQMFSLYHQETRTLINPIVLNDEGNIYFHQETYDLLTK